MLRVTKWWVKKPFIALFSWKRFWLPFISFGYIYLSHTRSDHYTTHTSRILYLDNLALFGSDCCVRSATFSRVGSSNRAGLLWLSYQVHLEREMFMLERKRSFKNICANIANIFVFVKYSCFLLLTIVKDRVWSKLYFLKRSSEVLESDRSLKMIFHVEKKIRRRIHIF